MRANKGAFPLERIHLNSHTNLIHTYEESRHPKCSTMEQVRAWEADCASTQLEHGDWKPVGISDLTVGERAVVGLSGLLGLGAWAYVGWKVSNYLGWLLS